MITTADFSQEARDYVQKIEQNIVLPDGNQLAQLMIGHDVGAAVTKHTRPRNAGPGLLRWHWLGSKKGRANWQ
jgi:restriction endonuclease Mrr